MTTTATEQANIPANPTATMNLVDRILAAIGTVHEKLGKEVHESLINFDIEAAIQTAREVMGNVPSLAFETEYGSLRPKAVELMQEGKYDKAAAFFGVLKYYTPNSAQAYFESGLALV